jgi:hypothetical protein
VLASSLAEVLEHPWLNVEIKPNIGGHGLISSLVSEVLEAEAEIKVIRNVLVPAEFDVAATDVNIPEVLELDVLEHLHLYFSNINYNC